MTDAVKDAVVDRYERGQSINFISFALSISQARVLGVLKERGVRVRKRGSPNRNWGWTGGMR